VGGLAVFVGLILFLARPLSVLPLNNTGVIRGATFRCSIGTSNFRSANSIYSSDDDGGGHQRRPRR
jgi:hypothetical protein